MCEVENGGLDGEGGRRSDWERINASSGSSSLEASMPSIEGEAVCIEGEVVFIVVVDGDVGVRGEGELCGSGFCVRDCCRRMARAVGSVVLSMLLREVGSMLLRSVLRSVDRSS